jgi:DNA-binding response OmpR family regulator
MKRVLIVEDQADIRELIRMSLELDAYEIDEADSGDSGWARMQERKPDLVLLDVMMPGSMDGLEVCRRIKHDDALRKTKVVMLTARGQESDRDAARECGADEYLIKPFSPLQLIQVVKRLVG